MVMLLSVLIDMFDWTVGAIIVALLFGAAIALRDKNEGRN